MKAAKNAMASAKEKVQNLGSKADQKLDFDKASLTEKIEKKMADDETEKREAEANKHIKQEQALRDYDQKRVEHAIQKEQTKGHLYEEEVDKHTLARAALNDNFAAQTPGTSVPAPGPAPANTPYVPGDGQDPNSSADTPATAPAHGNKVNPNSDGTTRTNPSGEGNVFDPSLAAADSGIPPVENHTGIPLHGSGVPAHSDLHQDKPDQHTTRIMGGTPNAGSYM